MGILLYLAVYSDCDLAELEDTNQHRGIYHINQGLQSVESKNNDADVLPNHLNKEKHEKHSVKLLGKWNKH